MVNRMERFKAYYKGDQGICTAKELRILELYGIMEVKLIAQDMNITVSSVHSIFHRIRKRRDLIQKRKKVWDRLCRDPRFYQVLQPKALIEQEDT